MREIRIGFQRKSEKNYMVLESEKSEYIKAYMYELEMLKHNKIQGIPDLYMQEKDEKLMLNYDISSMQSLSDFMESRSLSKADIKAIILGIITIVERINEYLIETRHLILDSDYIYIDSDNLNIKLVCIPYDENNFISAFGTLVNKIAKSIDKKDSQAVLISYSLQQLIEKDNYSLKNILDLFLENENMENPIQKGPSILDNPEECEKTEQINTYIEDKVLEEKVGEHKEKLKKAFSFKNIFKRDYDEKTGDNENKDITKDFWSDYVDEYKKENEKTVIYKDEYQENKVFAICDDIKKENMEIEYGHTVLLTSKKEKEIKTLYSKDRNVEDIEICYFPFVVGRQERICDYVLEAKGVSRLHFKLDKHADKFIITDLNSRNGIILRGRLLENREYDVINDGDEIEIAGLKYIFK